MFNNLFKRKNDETNSINRLTALKRTEESANKETNILSQSKSGSFSKALDAVRQDVGETQSGSSPTINKPSKAAVSFDEAINARREKTMNPFLRVSPQFQSSQVPKAE